MVTAKGHFEIKPRRVNKGFFISHIIKQEFNDNRHPDFIFALGDSTSDEEMFKYLSSVYGQLTYFKDNIKVFPCTIGRKPSSANYYLNEINEVLESLENLVQANSLTKEGKARKSLTSKSLSDISSFKYSRGTLKSESFTSLNVAANAYFNSYN